MSSQAPTPGGGPAHDPDGDAIERIADPDQYSHRRRLRQIHDAKEQVQETKRRALRLAKQQHNERVRRFKNDDRDKLVAEDCTAYIHELIPILEQTDFLETFREETIEAPDVTVTMEQYRRFRGTKPNTNEPLNYSASMTAWHICNRYFEKVAGAEFQASDPAPQANPVDPAGRFNANE